MTTYVIDASVAVKWFAPEIHSEVAARLAPGPDTLIAPDFLPIEMANAFWKHVIRGDASHQEAGRRLAILEQRVILFASRPLIESALKIAIDHTRTVYDSLYVALALRESCQAITADRRLYDAVAPHLPETMLWIEDFPMSEPDHPPA